MSKVRALAPRLAVAVVLLLLWEVSARVGLVNAQVLSSPSEVVGSFGALVRGGSLLTDVVHSVKRVLVGVAVGSLLGLAVGLLFGLRPAAERYLGFLLEMLRPIPPIAWIPIAILWFGLGDPPAFFLVSLGAFFPVFTNTLTGVRSIEARYVSVALSLGASRSVVFRRVLVPLVLPHLMTGLRVGLGVGWIIVITAEMVGAQSGLGYMIQLNRIMLQTPNVIAGMVTIALIGLALSAAMGRAQALLVPWEGRMVTVQGRVP